MTYVNRELADKYQDFFNFMNQEHNLILTKEEMDEILSEAERLVKKLPIHNVSNLLCGSFEPDNSTSSATKCKCGREKWEHPKAT